MGEICRRLSGGWRPVNGRRDGFYEDLGVRRVINAAVR